MQHVERMAKKKKKKKKLEPVIEEISNTIALSKKYQDFEV